MKPGYAVAVLIVVSACLSSPLKISAQNSQAPPEGRPDLDVHVVTTTWIELGRSAPTTTALLVKVSFHNRQEEAIPIAEGDIKMSSNSHTFPILGIFLNPFIGVEGFKCIAKAGTEANWYDIEGANLMFLPWQNVADAKFLAGEKGVLLLAFALDKSELANATLSLKGVEVALPPPIITGAKVQKITVTSLCGP